MQLQVKPTVILLRVFKYRESSIFASFVPVSLSLEMLELFCMYEHCYSFRALKIMDSKCESLKFLTECEMFYLGFQTPNVTKQRAQI